MNRKRPRILMTAALAVLVGACAAAGDGAGPGEESLEDFIPGVLTFDEVDWDDSERRRELAAQEAIAACMAKAGFEYIPYAPNYDEIGYGGPESDEEYVQEYGLGVSYHVLNQEFREGEGTRRTEAGYVEEGKLLDPGDIDAILGGFPDELIDPNWAIWDAMSEDEREAYDMALYGVYLETNPGGCSSEAIGKRGDESVLESFFKQFGDQVDGIHEKVEADLRIAELDSEWSKCMAGAGYTFDDEEDATSYVVGLLEEVGAVSVPANPQGALDYAPKPIEAGSDTYREVESIFKEEVAIAEASLKCQEGAYESYEAVYEAVYEEYEQAFIDNNHAALEQFREENS